MNMDLSGILALALLATLPAVMLFGYPVAFSLSGVAILFAIVGYAFDAFDFIYLNALPSRYFGIMTNQVLVAVPLFVFMGVMLERSKVAENLLLTMGECFGRIRGGLGMSVVLVGMLLAASTGIVGATVVTMGLLSLPAMLKTGYDHKLACGTVCASGTLGQIIPPSIVLVILGDVLAGAYTEAQIAKGNYDFEPFAILDLFAGALIPGLVLVLLYLIWLSFLALTRPDQCPSVESAGQRSGLAIRVLKVLVPPIFLIFSVLGSILAGLATPSEAASLGCVGALVLAAGHRKLNIEILKDVVRTSTRISAMVFGILLGASVFSLTFRGFGGDALVQEFLLGLPGGFFTGMLLIMVLMFLLGFVLDFIEIIFVVVPIVAPALLAADINPVWLGVMIAVNLQTSFLTPPFGWALFYLRGIAPDSIKTTDIYRGVIPFVIIQLIGLCILAYYPPLATWLPSIILR